LSLLALSFVFIRLRRGYIMHKSGVFFIVMSLSWQLYVALEHGTCSSHSLRVIFSIPLNHTLKLSQVTLFLESVSHLIGYPSNLWVLVMHHVSQSCFLVFFNLCYQVHYCVTPLYVQGKSQSRVEHLHISSYLLCQPSMCHLYIASSFYIIIYLILVLVLCR